MEEDDDEDDAANGDNGDSEIIGEADPVCDPDSESELTTNGVSGAFNDAGDMLTMGDTALLSLSLPLPLLPRLTLGEGRITFTIGAVTIDVTDGCGEPGVGEEGEEAEDAEDDADDGAVLPTLREELLTERVGLVEEVCGAEEDDECEEDAEEEEEDAESLSSLSVSIVV